jgi:hypothetical protein
MIIHKKFTRWKRLSIYYQRLINFNYIQNTIIIAHENCSDLDIALLIFDIVK